MWGSLAVCLIGMFYAYTINVTVGIAVMIAGCIALFLYSSAVDKKRKAMVRRLKREWREEQEEEVEK